MKCKNLGANKMAPVVVIHIEFRVNTKFRTIDLDKLSTLQIMS
jgi:hypothetical protein